MELPDQLRYTKEHEWVAVEGGRARAELRELARDRRFASPTGSDNVFAVTTDRYARTPLIVQGPGAGPEVTAAGVFADLLRIAQSLGARI